MPFVDTSLLRVGYEDLNPQGRKTVILMHGWPDSPRTWSHVAPRLVQAGYRGITGCNGITFHHDQKGNNDLLNLTRPEIVSEICNAYIDAVESKDE